MGAGKEDLIAIYYQLCGKLGHTNFKGYYWFDQTFQGPNNIDNNFVHFVTSKLVKKFEWLIDNGTSKHVTFGLNNLQQENEYQARKKIVVGNKQCLLMYNNGSSFIRTNNDLLHLNNTLYVLYIVINL